MKLKEGESTPDFISKGIFDRDIIMSGMIGNKIFLPIYRTINNHLDNKETEKFV